MNGWPLLTAATRPTDSEASSSRHCSSGISSRVDSLGTGSSAPLVGPPSLPEFSGERSTEPVWTSRPTRCRTFAARSRTPLQEPPEADLSFLDERCALRGKVAVVAGGGGGLGRAAVLDLARAGAAVALCDIDADALGRTAAVARKLGAETIEQAFDVRDD